MCMYDDATRLKSPFSIVQGTPSAVQPMETISETRLNRMLKSELVQMVMDFQQKVMDFQQKDQELARLHELEKEDEKNNDKENKEDKDRGDDREQEGKDEPSDDENSPTTKLDEESLVTIFIHDVANRKTESVQVELDDKPWLVKSILADRHNIRKRDQRLLYKGTEVHDDGRSLHAYGISADDTLDLFIVIAGGGLKRGLQQESRKVQLQRFWENTVANTKNKNQSVPCTNTVRRSYQEMESLSDGKKKRLCSRRG